MILVGNDKNGDSLMSALRFTIEGISDDTPAPKNTVQVLKLLVEPILEGLGWPAGSSSVYYDDHEGHPLIRLRGNLPRAVGMGFGEVDSRSRRSAAIRLLTPEENLNVWTSVPAARGESLDILARTNGFVWSFHIPRANGPYPCEDIDIRESPKRSANSLGRYLRKDNLSEGKARMAAERQLEPSEEKVGWILDEMKKQPSQQLIRSIQEYYESKWGRRPNEELVIKTLRSRLSEEGDDDDNR